jgi:hypothetical protein
MTDESWEKIYVIIFVCISIVMQLTLILLSLVSYQRTILGIVLTLVSALYSRSKILMEHPNNIALMHLNTRTMRWSVPRGPERSRYYITVKETVSQAMHVEGRHSDAIICSVILASLSNSYVEGSAQFIGACTGQTVRNHLRYQDPADLVRVNDDTITKLRSMGAFSKPRMLAIDVHDIMYYGDPD